MANLIVCCDGTWNTPDQKDGDIPSPTNVTKFYNILAATDGAGQPQKAYYHPGVGTGDGPLDSITGGGLGVGLSKNVKSGYAWLAREYQPGDRIHLIGFSRGAYTVRSLAGLIGKVGLAKLDGPKIDNDARWAAIDALFEHYRGRSEPPKGLRFHKGGDGTTEVGIHFLGVWDTVGALGVPDDLFLLNLLDRKDRHSFHDTTLGKSVRTARHALAMDESRQSFTPTLWTGNLTGRDVKQVWFSGVHSDVGGGYAESGLSDAALEWMVEEAETAGLAFRDGAKALIKPDPWGPRHDSLTGLFSKLRTRPRAVPALLEGSSDFHDSVLKRHKAPPLVEARYWTTTLLEPGGSKTVDVFAKQHWNETGVFLEAGKTYRLTATGQWVDKSMKADPDGILEDQSFLGRIIQGVSGLVGKLEPGLRRLLGNNMIDILGTKRVEDEPFFKLIGVIADGQGVEDETDQPTKHHHFAIGSKKKITPKHSGYLYCFANDAWVMYDNNSGSVSLTVSRT